ncbi:MAG TPA: ABC transporter permease [Chloroflexia bacterium]|jgi:putative ABC transport system permease protein
MRWLDYIKMALEGIGAAKLRSLLTSLGIIIGVGSVVLITSTGEGVSSAVTGAFSDLGSTRLTIRPSAPVVEGSGGSGNSSFGGTVAVASTLTVEDADALMGVAGVAASAPFIRVAGKVSGPAKTLDLGIIGTAPLYREATGQRLLEGRMFDNDADEAVLNEAGVKQLFGEAATPTTAIGQPIQINGRDYTLVGVFANEESPFSQGMPGGNAANQVIPAVYMPVDSALDLAGTQRVSQIMLTAENPEVVNSAMEGIKATLLSRHGGVQDFTISSFQQLLSSFNQVFSIITVFLSAIASISLVVGGIGIMNIMLVTVTERTREIGIAKAIGATRMNIVLQFLVEAITLSLIGGLLGLAVAWLGTWLLGQFLGLPSVFSLQAIALTVGISAAIGIFFGVVPAWRAARLDPIVALRHE